MAKSSGPRSSGPGSSGPKPSEPKSARPTSAGAKWSGAKSSEARPFIHRTLIDCAALTARLGDPALVLLDCRFDLADAGAGRRAWQAGHLPGAQHADLERDLSGPPTPLSGRHPLPEPVQLATRLGALGVGPDTQVVAYDDGPGAMAARLWWLCRWIGHEAVAVLDGGLRAWRAAGGSVTAATSAPQPRELHPRRSLARTATADSLHAATLAAAGTCLVDARTPQRFSGQAEPIDPVAGHVPGARNHPFERNLDADGRFLPPAALRERWAQTLGGARPQQVVAMCGSGVTACHLLLALEHAGLPGARLYAGSWSEWIRDPRRPVATGVDTAADD